MFNIKKSLFSFFLFIFIVLPLFLSGMTKASIIKEKKLIKELEGKKKEEEEKRKTLKANRSKVEKEIENLDILASEIVLKLENLGEKIDKNEKRLEVIEGELLSSEQKEEKHFDIMKKRVKYAYENGDSDLFDIITGSGNMEEFLNTAEYLSEIAEYDKGVLDRYLLAKEEAKEKREAKKEELALLTANKKLAEAELEKNKAISKQKEKKFKEYNGLIAKSDSVITKFSGEIAEKEAHVDRLIALEEKRRKEREERERQARLQRQRQTNQSAPSSKAGFSWPLPGYSYISSGFGYRGVVMKGSGSFHSGIDLPAPFGTPIVASLDGTVVGAGYHYSMGNYVLLSHGGGLYTVYMHASKLLVSSGAYVSKGQRIALVGSTGFSTGPHLHFGIKVNGSYQNPMNFFR